MLGLILALTASANAHEMPLPDIDRELSEIVYSARGGWLLHALTHFECGDADRTRQRRELAAEYKKLEREYIKLGGTVESDDRQGIMEEAVHYQCLGGRSTSELMRKEAVQRSELDLSRMRSLLARKTSLIKQR